MNLRTPHSALHPVARLTVIWIAALVAINLILWLSTGIRFDQTAARLQLGVIPIVGLFLAIGYFYRFRRPDPRLSETSFAAAFVLAATQLAGLYSIFLTVCAPPLIDSQLAAIDAALGLHAPAFSMFVLEHPWLQHFVIWSYDFFISQIFLTIVVLGIVLDDADALWAYVYYYLFAATVALACFSVVQAEGTTSWYTDYPSNRMLTAYLDAFRALRSGTVVELTREHLQGFITFPSFHTASALAALAAFSKHPRIWWPLLLINAGLVMGTVAVGGHFVIDSLSSVLICAAGILTYRKLVLRTHSPKV